MRFYNAETNALYDIFINDKKYDNKTVDSNSVWDCQTDLFDGPELRDALRYNKSVEIKNYAASELLSYYETGKLKFFESLEYVAKYAPSEILRKKSVEMYRMDDPALNYVNYVPTIKNLL